MRTAQDRRKRGSYKEFNKEGTAYARTKSSRRGGGLDKDNKQDWRSACGVSRMDGMSNESVYEHLGMCHVGEGKKCGVVEEVKRQTLKRFGHMELTEESKMTRRVYVNEIEGGNVKG